MMPLIRRHLEGTAVIEIMTNIPMATILITEVTAALVVTLVFVKTTARPIWYGEIPEQYVNGEDHGRS